jgi:hypothetical protein
LGVVMPALSPLPAATIRMAMRGMTSPDSLVF